MLLEVGGRGIVGRALDDTIDLLKEASESIRLKVARPDAQTSVLTVEGGEEVSEVCVCVCVCVCVGREGGGWRVCVHVQLLFVCLLL